MTTRFRPCTFAALGMVVSAGVVSGCAPEVRPPETAGVCWLMTGSAKQPRFAPVAEYNANLYSCAGQLEAVRMRRGREVTGAYNGHFIFVTTDAVQTADRLTGSRAWVFSTQQRAELQKEIREALKRDPEFGTVRAASQPGAK